MMQPNHHVRVGLAVIVKNDKGQVLLGKRRNAHGDGAWAFPGGHLEYGESFEACAKREVAEETTLDIDDITFVTTTNDLFVREQKHYVTIFITAKIISGTVYCNEPHKCERWEWFDWDRLPTPLFLPIEHLLKTSSSSI